eukprot:CAMPEP_0178381736 /NCGR_PEP_ID=MMETSP0689_2-20121128/6140_1 /TAXON_ID=160604 /ORGANISM="Amphidinium massartii, Strain CS-259" /LENGTH=220 /DNA_ID=CAMNT_0020001935 /DNA_START=167 /DNA_END=829 /DNA_ORIENTATION=-
MCPAEVDRHQGVVVPEERFQQRGHIGVLRDRRATERQHLQVPQASAPRELCEMSQRQAAPEVPGSSCPKDRRHRHAPTSGCSVGPAPREPARGGASRSVAGLGAEVEGSSKGPQRAAKSGQPQHHEGKLLRAMRDAKVIYIMLLLGQLEQRQVLRPRPGRSKEQRDWQPYFATHGLTVVKVLPHFPALIPDGSPAMDRKVRKPDALWAQEVQYSLYNRRL